MPSQLSPRDIDTLAFRQSRHGAIVLAPEVGVWPIVDVNDAYLTLTHRKREELLGRPLFEAFPESAGTTADHGSHRIAASLQDALRGKTTLLPVQRYDLVDKTAAGGFSEQYWQLSTAPLVDGDRCTVALLHEVQNVTARVIAEREAQDLMVELETQTEELQATATQLEERTEEAEAARRTAEFAESRLNIIFAQTPAAIGVTSGPDHRFVLANRGYERLVGRTVRIGGTFREVLPEIAAQGFEALLDRVYRTGEPYVAHESPAKIDRGNGLVTDGWFDFVYQPLIDADKRVIGVLQQGIDITAQVEARHAAEAAAGVKGEFLAVMSHELRTPLNALGGYLELLLTGVRGPVSDEQRHDLERMQRSQRHLLSLINNVLDFSRIDKGHVEFTSHPVDVGAELRRVEEMIAPQCRAKNISCELDVATPAAIAMADEERVGQIILNLLSNAVKFTPSGGTISARCERDGDHVVVSISDTGAGIPAGKLDAIFDPFFQVGRQLNAPIEGVGLGLSIARSLAEGMHGTLTVTSVPREGSIFTLSLPAA